MGLNQAIDISADQRKTILGLLGRYLPNTTAWVYGSRVKWTSRPQSDLDMVVFSAPEQHLKVSDLREAFEESNLPFRVDLFVWDEVPEQFRKQINAEHVVLVQSIEAKSIQDSDWQTTSWGELASLEYGKAFRYYKSSTGPYRVFGTNGPIGWHDEMLHPHPGVIIGRKGAYRGVHYSAKPFYVIDTAFFLKPKVEMDTRWAYYELLGQNINDLDSGSAIPSTRREDFYNLSVKVPPLAEQRAIAHILGTLDEKIELNRRMNETLEAMARALFKSWFVDFDPVRAKMKGKDLRLPPDIADLFPDRLVSSELGEIPEGWEVNLMEGFATVIYGAPFASKRFNSLGTGFPLIRIRDLATHNPGVFTDEQHPRGTLINPGDIVVGMDGEFRAHFWKGPMAWLNQRVCHFKPHLNVPRTFLCESLIGPLADIERAKVGTTVIHLGKADIDSIMLRFPTDPVLKAFAQFTEPLTKRIVANAKESRNIIAQRDALLPKLISGQLPAGDA